MSEHWHALALAEDNRGLTTDDYSLGALTTSDDGVVYGSLQLAVAQQPPVIGRLRPSFDIFEMDDGEDGDGSGGRRSGLLQESRRRRNLIGVAAFTVLLALVAVSHLSTAQTAAHKGGGAVDDEGPPCGSVIGAWAMTYTDVKSGATCAGELVTAIDGRWTIDQSKCDGYPPHMGGTWEVVEGGKRCVQRFVSTVGDETSVSIVLGSAPSGKVGEETKWCEFVGGLDLEVPDSCEGHDYSVRSIYLGEDGAAPHRALRPAAAHAAHGKTRMVQALLRQ